MIVSKDEFVAAVSHELRTPLTGVVGFATELSDSWDAFSEGERREFINVIAQQGDDLSEIIEDLLTAARADTGTLTIELQATDVHAVASSIAREEGVEMRAGGEDAEAMCDPVRLRQIVRNLATNARRYGGEQRWLEVRAGSTFVHVRMCDDGQGIPGTNPDHVFEAYERGHDSTGQPASVGLGLSVARTLARLMGGDVTYAREGSTTVFDCTLPRVLTSVGNSPSTN